MTLISPLLPSNLIKNSYINHISHIENIPNPEQIQYMNFAHSVAWSFSKEKKCKIKYFIYSVLIIIYSSSIKG